MPKFQALNFLQKRKKISYYLHRSIQEDTDRYLADITLMVTCINEQEYRKLTFQPTIDGLKELYQLIHKEVLENDPFQEDILFDNPHQERVLLTQPIRILLDNIRSPFNVGAFFRMAEAFGIHEVIGIGVTPSPQNERKVQKTAKGHLIQHRTYAHFDAFLGSCSSSPSLLAIEKAKGSRSFISMKFEPLKEYYLIFGNEEFGISTEILRHCETIYHIPMLGSKNSLNVSVAGGIILNHVARVINGDF